MAAPDDVSSFFAASLGDSIETSTGTNSDGLAILRTRSRPIPYPLPGGDVNDPGAWNKAEVRLADVGVGTYISIFPPF
jgi:hypothetical protein